MCGCTTLTVRQGLLSTHVHPDRERIVRRHSPRHEEIFSAKRLHVLSLAQDEALEHGVRQLHFEVDSIDLGIPERTEVKVELSEPGRSRHIELYFLAQLAPERTHRSLTGIDCPAEAAPMRRRENLRLSTNTLSRPRRLSAAGRPPPVLRGSREPPAQSSSEYGCRDDRSGRAPNAAR